MIVRLIQKKDVMLRDHHACDEESSRFASRKSTHRLKCIIATKEHLAHGTADILIENVGTLLFQPVKGIETAFLVDLFSMILRHIIQQSLMAQLNSAFIGIKKLSKHLK